jgi:hypothetical protein
MTIILGMRNDQAHRLLEKNGQPIELIKTLIGGADPVSGTVTSTTEISTAMKGFPYPVSSEYASYYGFSNVSEKDVFFFIEAIVEPDETMKLAVLNADNSRGDTFTIVKAQAITKAGNAYLFIVQAQK